MKRFSDKINERLKLNKDTKLYKETYFLIQPQIGSAENKLDEFFGEDIYLHLFLTNNINRQKLYCISLSELKELLDKDKRLRYNLWYYHMIDEENFTIDKLAEYNSEYSGYFSMKDLDKYGGIYKVDELKKLGIDI